MISAQQARKITEKNRNIPILMEQAERFIEEEANKGASSVMLDGIPCLNDAKILSDNLEGLGYSTSYMSYIEVEDGDEVELFQMWIYW